MKPTLVVGCGSAAAAVLLQLLRIRALEEGKIRRRLPGEPLRERRLEEMRSALQVVALDTDGNQVFRLHPPVDPVEPVLPVSDFRRTRLPGRDFLNRLLRRPGGSRFEAINAEALRALDAAENAAGGVRNLGWLALAADRPAVRQLIRDRLVSLAGGRYVRSTAAEHGIRVVIVAGTFGGTGTGMHDEVCPLVAEVVDELQFAVEIHRVLLVPGAAEPQDPARARATSFGVLAEISANATNRHWHRSRTPGGEPVVSRTRFLPTLLLSDANSAPTPRVLDAESFHGMVAGLLWSWLDSPLGDVMDSRDGDMRVDAERRTSTGERLALRSAGISVIYLDRDRAVRYMIDRTVAATLEPALAAVDAQVEEQSVRAFLEARSIVEGQGLHQLTHRLLEPPERAEGPTPERFLALFRAEMRGRAPLDLLLSGRLSADLALAQAGELGEALQQRADDTARSFDADMRKWLRQQYHDRHRGLEAARGWLARLGAVLEFMAHSAAQDAERFDDEVAEQQRLIDYYEQEYTPRIQAMKGWLRFLRRASIRQGGAAYVRALEAHRLAVMRRSAHVAASRLLERLAGDMARELDAATAMVAAAAGARDLAGAEADRLAQHPPHFDAPVGLALLDSPDRFRELHRHVVEEDAEERIAIAAYGAAFPADGTLSAASTAELLLDRLRAEIQPEIARLAGTLHVVDELRRRFPQRETLGALFRERDREAHEYLQIRPAAASDHGLEVIRLIGLDLARGGGLQEILGQHVDPRNAEYQVIDMPDPERIILIQYRNRFACSDWAHFDAGREAHAAAGEQRVERCHVVPGQRFLPVPGRFLDEHAAAVVAVKAWLLDELHWDAASGQWYVASACGTEDRELLGPDLEHLLGVDGYDIAVGIASRFDCHYFAVGPTAVESRLKALSAGGGAETGEKARLAALATPEARRRLRLELEWWRRNTVPALLASARRHAARNGNGGAASPPADAAAAD